MERLQRIKEQIGLRWRQLWANKVLVVAVVVVLSLVLGVGIGIYSYPRPQDTPTAVPQLTEEDVAVVVRQQIQTVLAEDYPWVLEERAIPVVVEPPQSEKPNPTSPRPVSSYEEAVSFEHLLWPVKGEINTPFGWYRHPVYEDWRFNAGVEFQAQGDMVRTVLAGTVLSVTSDGLQTELVIDHGSGWTSTYRSIQALSVVPGQEVKQNQNIAIPGTDGIVFFGLNHQGEPVNPQAFLR